MAGSWELGAVSWENLRSAMNVARLNLVIPDKADLVLGGVVQTTAIYEGTGNVNVAAKTCEQIAMALDLPEAVVLDVGLLSDGRWAFVEANAAWGAGLNGCDPVRVVPCIAAATRTQ